MNKTSISVPGEISEEEALRRLGDLKPAFEMGHQYARIERATVMPDGQHETDAEHAVSLAMIGIAYAAKYHPELNPHKLAFYFLFHDLDEYLHGDVSSLGISADGYRDKVEKEKEAAEERRRRLNLFPEFLALLDEMDDLTIPEYAFGKAFDKLSPGYTHEANDGITLIERYGIRSYEDIVEAASVVDEKMYEYAAAFTDVIALRHATHRRVAGFVLNRPRWVDDTLF